MSNNIAVNYIAERWGHHSDHSSYDQLIRYVAEQRPVRVLDGIWPSWMPGRVPVLLARRSGVRHYTYTSFHKEWSAIRNMAPRAARGRRSVYHILYGENSYRYLGGVSKLFGARLVATFHQPPSALGELLRTVDHLKRLDTVIVVGTNQIPFFEALLGPGRVFWVPHGVDTQVFRPAERRHVDAQIRGHDAGHKRQVLFVGQHKRDFTTLLNVIEQVHARQPGVRFVVVTAEKFRHLFEGQGQVDLRHRVPEEELIDLYRSSDLLLQTLEDSTANNAILEGLACGLPVIATEVGGVSDYLDETCGVLLQPKDAQAVAEAILELLSDEERRCRLAVQARQRALEFDWRVVAQKMGVLYDQLRG